MDRALEIALPTYIENWPVDLKALSIPQVGIELTKDDMVVLGTSIPELYELFEEYSRIHSHILREPAFKKAQIEIRLDIGKAMNFLKKRVPKHARNSIRFFVRLGSRSPKDSWVVHKRGGMKVKDSREAWDVLTGVSERIAEDLLLALRNDYNSHLFIRLWYDIPKWAEFRCFIKGRQLVGISQYFYREFLPEISKNSKFIKEAITSFIEESVIPTLHLDDVVVDVFLQGLVSAEDVIEIKKIFLLEINPFYIWTDPCLYCWGKETGLEVGSFRFIQEPIKSEAEKDIIVQKEKEK